MQNWLTERYRIEGTVGKGSAATVYRVWDKNDNRTLALKRLSNRDKAGYERRVALFQQEYYTLVDLAHPFIIEVYDYGLVDDDPYYTMELLEGEELSGMAPLNWQRACGLLRDIATSLAIIHSRRLVHRDLSARNVRCNKSGRAKLIDFGAMVSMGAVRDVSGTAAFMAPEVVYGQPLEGRADLFSLGALAYWLLSGRYAYTARNIQQLKDAWRSVPRSLTQINESIPTALDTLVISMLSLDKLARPVNAAEVIDRLTAIAQLEQSEVLEVSQAYVTTPTIVGRERELDIFRKQMASALRGRGSTIVLEGVSGVGRSRLLSSFILEGKLAGSTVLSADSCGVRGGDYAMISALVERMLEALPEEALEAARPEAAVLGHVIPSLRAKTRAVELCMEADPARLRARIQRALQDVFTRVLSGVSLVISVDDILLRDEPSVAALATLAKISSSHRLLVAVTLNQEGEIHQSKALRALRSSAIRIELKPLGESDTAWLMQSMFGDVANINVVSDWIYKLSRGNLRTCMELAQHLVDNKIARYQEGNWILPKDLREQKLPKNLVHALEARVVKLSPPARALAESLSLVTEYAPLKLEHYVTLSESEDERSTYLALDELVASQVLLRSGDDYSFSQPGYVDVLQRHLDGKRRRRIHLKLAAVYRSVNHDHKLVLIHHLQQAGEGEKALELLIPLFDKIEIVEGPCSLQVRCCESALSLVENDKFKKKEALIIRRCLINLARRYDLSLLKYADKQEEQLRRDSGLIFWDKTKNYLDPTERIQRCLQKAQEVWEATPEQERGLDPLEAVRELLAYTVMMMEAISPTADPEFISYLRTLIIPFRTLSPAVGFFDQLLELSIDQAYGYSVYQKHWAMQERYSEQIPEIDEEVRSEIINFINPYYIALDEANTANPVVLERAALLEQDPRFTMHAWEVRLVYHLFAGNFRQALACLRQKELLAIQDPESDIRLFAGLLFEAWAYSVSGDLMGLKRVLVPITEKAERYPGWVPVLLAVRGNYHFLRGDLMKARRDLEKMLKIAPIGRHYAWIRGLPVLVETLIEMGALEDAREIATKSLETVEAIGAHHEAVRELRRVLALVYAKFGDIERAFDLIETTIEKANADNVGGVPLAVLYETAARIAICGNNVDRFIACAKVIADIYGPGKNPALIAKYAQLMLDAERSQLPGQWRIQTPLETDFLNTRSATRILQLVYTAMSDCKTLEQGYEKALELLVQFTDASHGYIYAIVKEGLSFMAPKQKESAPAGLGSRLFDYLASWRASRTGQQLETQTLASRTLSRTSLTERNTIVTREDIAFQPLVLWVENQDEAEVVSVVALSAAELPLEDLLWPFTSVIARYLLELRA